MPTKSNKANKTAVNAALVTQVGALERIQAKSSPKSIRTKSPLRIDRSKMRRARFQPTEGRMSVRLMYEHPNVAFTQEAIDKMGAYVGLMSYEVGWMASVERSSTDLFVVTDCFLFGQDVHSTTTEIDAEMMGKMAHEIIASNPENGAEIINSLRCWGHSHINMATNPSGQDERQMEDFASMVEDYMIRVIANKRGDMRVDIFDYERGLVFENVDWDIIDDMSCDLSDAARELEEKVSVIGYAPVARTSSVSTSVQARNGGPLSPRNGGGYDEDGFYDSALYGFTDEDARGFGRDPDGNAFVKD